MSMNIHKFIERRKSERKGEMQMNEEFVKWLMDHIKDSKELLEESKKKCNAVESAYNEGQIDAFETCLSAVQNS